MIGTALVCLTLGVIVWRAEAALRTLFAQRTRLQERELTLRERELAMLEERQAASLDPEEMPVDLLMRCAAETEDWARDQLRSLVQQLYMRHKNWDSVRTEMAKLDMAAAHADAGWSITRMAS